MPRKVGKELVDSRRNKRLEIMGKHGVDEQDKRNARAEIKGAVTPGDSIMKARGRQAIKRVGEYREANAQKAKIKRMNTPIAKAVRDERKSQFDSVASTKKFNP